MPTDDDRREVAARLRKAIGLTGFAEVLGFNWTDDSDWGWNDVSNVVADLIEPEPERTCRVKSSHEEEGDGCYAYFEYELSCGHEIAWGDQLPPSYCPECGRRLLYDSNDYI